MLVIERYSATGHMRRRGMDQTHTEFVNGITVVPTLQELEQGVWAARTMLDGVPFEARAATAERAREALLVALSSEIPMLDED
jgi:hypothetical protein